MGCEIFVVALIGTVILQAAVVLFNRLAGGLRKAIKEPKGGTACGIVVAAHLVGDVASIAMQIVGGVLPLPEQYRDIIFKVMSLPLAIAAMTLMNKLLLPTDFRKAILLSLLYYAIAVSVVILVVGPIILFGSLSVRPG